MELREECKPSRPDNQIYNQIFLNKKLELKHKLKNFKGKLKQNLFKKFQLLSKNLKEEIVLIVLNMEALKVNSPILFNNLIKLMMKCLKTKLKEL